MSYYTQPHKKRTKADNQIAHAQKRAVERFGIHVNIGRVVKMIQNGESKCLKKQNHRLSHHRVVYEGREMIAVYDKVRKVVTTFLFEKEVYLQKIEQGEIL